MEQDHHHQPDPHMEQDHHHQQDLHMEQDHHHQQDHHMEQGHHHQQDHHMEHDHPQKLDHRMEQDHSQKQGHHQVIIQETTCQNRDHQMDITQAMVFQMNNQDDTRATSYHHLRESQIMSCLLMNLQAPRIMNYL